MLGNIKYIEIHFVCFFSFFHVSTQGPEVTAGLTFLLVSGSVQVDAHLPSRLPRADFTGPTLQMRIPRPKEESHAHGHSVHCWTQANIRFSRAALSVGHISKHKH